VEVENINDAILAAEMSVDIIMFDNMALNEIQKAVKMLEEKGSGIILSLKRQAAYPLKMLISMEGQE